MTSGTLQTTWASTVNTNRAVGQVNLAAATNNYWQVTGVQLELGNVASDFDFQDFGTELAACQRYYEKSYNTNVNPGTATGVGSWSSQVSHLTSFQWFPTITFTTKKRATPTITFYSPVTGATGKARRNSSPAADQEIAVLSPGETGMTAFINGVSNAAGVELQVNWVAESEL